MLRVSTIIMGVEIEFEAPKVTYDKDAEVYRNSSILIVRTWLWFIIEREMRKYKPSLVRFSQPPGSVLIKTYG
jgi:hypothetical protein